MCPALITPRELSGEIGGARRFEGNGVGPFAQHGLDEALGLAVVFRRVGLRADL